jgi:uncharacterized OB-fold protein
LKEGKILAVKCDQCSHVFVPPKIVCPDCFGLMDTWLELPGQGTLLTYTEINYASPAHPVDPPFILGSIQMDDADTALVHLLGEVAAEDLKAGLKVAPVFKQNPEGNILDIEYFKPL